MTRPGPFVFVGFAVAIALLLVGWLLRRPAGEQPAPVAREEAASPARPAAGPLPPGVKAPEVEAASSEPDPPLDEAEERAAYNRAKAETARRVIETIKQNRDYPFWTRPISDANRWAPPQPVHNTQRSPLSEHQILDIWPAKKIFSGDEPVVVHARVLDDGKPVAVGALIGFTDSDPALTRPEVHFAFNDAGTDGDAHAGDHVYSATIRVSDEDRRKHAGPWGFRVRASVGKAPIETMNGFILWPGEVVLTGRYRDALEDGSLVVYVGVQAARAASTQVRAELHGPQGEELAFGWANAEVPAGESEVRLQFWGKTLFDRGVDGPYRLVHVVVGMPARKLIGPVATDVAHVTKPYGARQFRSDAFNAGAPMFQEQLDNWEERLRKAERGELDPAKGE